MLNKPFENTWLILVMIILGSFLAWNVHLLTGSSHQIISPSSVKHISSNFGINKAMVNPLIRIESDEQFRTLASSRGWRGDGSFSNPYIISDLMFPEGTSPIRILNTEEHFILVNNTFINQNDAIFLYNVEHAVIYNNTFMNPTGSAIIVTTCTDIRIIRNSINNSHQYGIYIKDTNNFTIERNIIQYSGSNSDFSAVKIEEAQEGIVVENTLNRNYGSGLNLDKCTDNLLSFNQIIRTDFEGIKVDEVKECSILNNRIIRANNIGISVANSTISTISGNLVQYSSLEGIKLSETENSSISGNHMWSCNIGIFIDTNSNHNTIFDNRVEASNNDGIKIESSSNCLLTSNLVINNDRYGINVEACENISVRWNDFSNNYDSGIQGFSNNIIGLPHLFENNYWGLNNITIYFLDGNANSNDSIPQVNHSQLYSLILDPISEGFTSLLLLEWSFSYINNWNLTYTVSISHNAGNHWIELVTEFTNELLVCNFSELPISSHYLVKIVAKSENGVQKIVFSEKFRYLNWSNKMIFISPSNAQEISDISMFSWDYSSTLNLKELYHNIYISKNNITWLLVQAWIFGNSFNWNTLNFEDGEYFLKITTFTYNGVLQECFFNGKFEIDNHYINPEPVLITPTEGEILRGNVFLSWTESVDSKGFSITYNLYYSSIEGWEGIVLNFSSSSYTWDTTTVKDGSNYRIRIEARGGLNEYTDFESTFSFTIDNVTTPPLETAIIFILVIAVTGLITVVYFLRRRLTAAELALKIKELRIGICLGTYTDKGLILRQKNGECPYDDHSLLSALEYGAVLAQRSEYEKIYGPFPHPPDEGGIEWYNVIFGFKIQDSQVIDSRIVQQHGETPALLLLYYPSHFDVLFMLQKQKIEEYLVNVLKSLDIDTLLLQGFDSIHEQLRQILLDYKPIDMDLVLEKSEK